MYAPVGAEDGGEGGASPSARGLARRGWAGSYDSLPSSAALDDGLDPAGAQPLDRRAAAVAWEPLQFSCAFKLLGQAAAALQVLLPLAGEPVVACSVACNGEAQQVLEGETA